MKTITEVIYIKHKDGKVKEKMVKIDDNYVIVRNDQFLTTIRLNNKDEARRWVEDIKKYAEDVVIYKEV